MHACTCHEPYAFHLNHGVLPGREETPLKGAADAGPSPPQQQQQKVMAKALTPGMLQARC
jgi:hypothetical protein